MNLLSFCAHTHAVSTEDIALWVPSHNGSLAQNSYQTVNPNILLHDHKRILNHVLLILLSFIEFTVHLFLLMYIFLQVCVKIVVTESVIIDANVYYAMAEPVTT